MMPTIDKSCRILVVEDGRMIRAFLIHHLKNEGFTSLFEAEDGQKAMEVLETEKIDLILLDIMMPVMDGYEALKLMKEDPVLRDIPVIMITSIDDIESVAKCIEMGAEDYMPKQFNPILLRSRISSCLERKRLQARVKELEEELIELKA